MNPQQISVLGSVESTSLIWRFDHFSRNRFVWFGLQLVLTCSRIYSFEPGGGAMNFRKFLTPALALGLFLIPTILQAQDYAIDPAFLPTFTGRTHQNFDVTNAIAIQPDQKILLGGDFTSVNGDACPLIVRLNPNGTRDTTFNSPLGFQANDEVKAIKLLPNGKMLVSGIFRVDGVQSALVRLNANGSLDLNYSPTVTGWANSIDLYPDGRFVICGTFGLNLNANKIARLFADGTVDSSFTGVLSGNQCSEVKLLPSGGMYVSGDFSGANGFSAPGLAKLNADGTTDTSFQAPVASYPVNHIEHFRIALQPDGLLLAARKVWAWNAQQDLISYPAIVRYSQNGTVQQFNNCGYYEAGTFFYVQSDGRIITSGCSMSNPSFTYGFARLFSDGALDTSLNRLTMSGGVRDVVRQADGNYVVAGNFSTVGGLTRPRVFRLVTDVVPAKHRFDFDGDGKDDIGVFRPSDRYWYLNGSTAGFSFVQWGLATDQLVAADYDNDGKTDVAVFRDGTWYTLKSSNNTLMAQTFGQAGDRPYVGDMNGDGLVDLVVRRPMPNDAVQWQIRYQGATGTSATQNLFGESQSDRAFVADLSGDGTDEMVFFHNGQWYSRTAGSTAQPTVYYFGSPGDIPVPADYDHDGQMDYAVFRPSLGDWYINLSRSGFTSVHFGASGDIPVPADYDGDGRSDIAVFRNGIWYQIRSGDGSFRGEAWGLAGDMPIPAQAQ